MEYTTTMNEDDRIWRDLLETTDTVYGKDEVRIDYSVLSVGVMTLGLILIVEVLRHKLDHVVHHHLFYRSVLEGVYSELATLGIVEFCLFLMATYYEDYDKKKYKVFAAVHFLLFYTAILNALGTALLHSWVQRISHRQWVATEDLDLDHYVELREQFDRVKEQLNALHHTSKRRRKRVQLEKDTDEDEGVEDLSESLHSDESDDDDTQAEDDFHFSHAIHDLMDRIRYPVMKSKYDRLLQQVRFHELRVHFLQAYSLPLKFKVSDYLLRSEQGVLLKLIHVSPIAWLLLTGVVNLFYYILGIVSYKARDTEIVGKAMTAIFFTGIFLFLLISWLLANKMKWIFKTIMHSDTLWDIHHGQTGAEKERLAEEQKDLFWAGDPKLVIAAIQFMMFGYAIVISTLIIFWDEIAAGAVPIVYFVLAVSVCFFLFIGETGSVIPRYTLCTSLAQLVDECRLHEALGAFHLAESKRIDHDDYSQRTGRPDSVLLESQSVISEAPSIDSSSAAAHSLAGGSKNTTLSKSTSANALVEMVKSDTASLRVYLLADSESFGRRKNVKQSSDGVAGMRRTRQHSDGVSGMRRTEDDIDVQPDTLMGIRPAPQQRTRRKARSEGVSFMAMVEHMDLYGNNGATTPREEDEAKENDDEASVHSQGSAHSDLNDIPAPSPDFGENGDHDEHKEESIPLADQFYSYFMSRRHIVVSNVFGTMIAFFFVGQRVESFFISEGIASTKFVHFDFAHEYIFWLLVLWLLCFIMKFFAVMYALAPRSRELFKEQAVTVATYLDLALCVFCLMMLLLAESKRCCYPELEDETARYLYETEKVGVPCSCPRFGTRQYGGLGWIEPWVSLLALRVFRHYVAKRIVEAYYHDEHSGNPELLRAQSLRLNPFDVFGHSERPTTNAANKHEHNENSHHIEDDHGHDDHGHGHEEYGTAAELWERTLGKHPELAAKHGEFSCEILRAMLGLSTGDSETPSEVVGSGSQTEKLNARVPELPRATAAVPKPADPSKPRKQPPAPIPTRIAARSRSAAMESMFSNPKARLLRSMRRCDRKFLPILDEWSVVDVVMTRFELVYFAADDVDDGLDIAGINALESLQNTKGGKGLRLSKVAEGRRVVGHVHISDIVSVHVDRSQNSTSEPELTNVEVLKTEFWKNRTSSKNGVKRGERWNEVPQDILKLGTRQSQTLYLRFYSDLEEEEMIRDTGINGSEDTLHKDNALHWAQTVGRMRGKQLDQELPHFGEGNDAEFLDYLDAPGLKHVHPPLVLEMQRVEL